LDINLVKELVAGEGGDIYLCGGGRLASWLLEHEMIDLIKLKLNPFIQGEGTKLFAATQKIYQLDLLDTVRYEQGLQLMSYQINYSGNAEARNPA
jgi:dihydrofolate reductase